MKRLVAIMVVVGAAIASAQPTPPSGGSASGSGSASASASGSGSASASGSGSGSTSGSGSASGSGSGSAIIIQLDPEAPEVSAAASPTELKLGQRFTLFVRAIMNQGIEVNLREPVDLGGAFEVGKRVSEDRIQPDGRRMREWQIEVRVWELGDVRIPPIAVTYTDLGKANQVETNTVPLHVTGVLGDSDDPKLMRDAALPIDLHEKSFLKKLLEWFQDPTHLAIVIGALVGMWLGWRFRRLRRRRVTRLVGGLVPMNAPRRRIDMTSERALERLLAIEQSGQLARDDQRRAGYAEMTDVIRDYLGARYNVLTTEMTSSELLKALAGKAAESETALVERWLDGADVVKYGNFPATRDEAYATLEGARRVVIATTKPRQAAVQPDQQVAS
jgi:hypothetical protein